MRKNLNSVKLDGRVYQHDLKVKTVQNKDSANFGKEFIGGTLDIATDDAGLNVVTVYFTYVTPTTKAGAANKTFSALKKIIDGGKTWMEVGPEEAYKVNVNTSFAVNDFYTAEDELVSQKRCEGGFVTIVSSLGEECDRNKFTQDMVITNVNHIDADPDKNIAADYAVVKGCVFNFKNDIIPIEFNVRNEGGIKHFEDLGATPAQPVYIKLWGKVVSTTEKVERRVESAFGDDEVSTYDKKSKEFLITGASKVPYDFGDESVMTTDELTKAMQNREVHLADVKKRTEEWRATQGTSTTSTATASVSAGGFNF